MHLLLLGDSNRTDLQLGPRLVLVMHSVYFNCYQTFHTFGTFRFSICHKNTSLNDNNRLYYLNKDVQDRGDLVKRHALSAFKIPPPTFLSCGTFHEQLLSDKY